MSDHGGGEGVALARSIAQTSRPAGSAAEEQARAECARFLAARGFDVDEQAFEYPAAKGRVEIPRLGRALALVTASVGANLVWTGVAARAVLGLAVAYLLFAAAELLLGNRPGLRPGHGRRRSGVNLVARRGVPEVWLVAHLDTKGQPVSLLVRAGGAILVTVGWLVTLGGWIVYALDGTGGFSALVGGLIAAGIGALPLAASVVLDRGTGALDNASGIASIFETIDRLDPDFSVGVVVTTAEELALAGARAWAATEPPSVALNCDGVDDEGEIVCVVGRDRQGRLARAIDQARAAAAMRVHVRRTLPGVLFDSVALAQAGWDTMTVTRGTVRSLARVHTAGDTLAAWRGDGVAGVAAFLADVAGAIVAEQHDAQHGKRPALREE